MRILGSTTCWLTSVVYCFVSYNLNKNNMEPKKEVLSGFGRSCSWPNRPSGTVWKARFHISERCARALYHQPESVPDTQVVTSDVSPGIIWVKRIDLIRWCALICHMVGVWLVYPRCFWTLGKSRLNWSISTLLPSFANHARHWQGRASSCQSSCRSRRCEISWASQHHSDP